MIAVSPELHLAGHRFGVIAGVGARKVGRLSLEVPSLRTGGEVIEFALPGGEVVARKVVSATGAVECWLREDLALAAQAALDAEAAANERAALEVARWSREVDQRAADKAGVSLEHYRTQRNFRGMAYDRARAANRTGASR